MSSSLDWHCHNSLFRMIYLVFVRVYFGFRISIVLGYLIFVMVYLVFVIIHLVFGIGIVFGMKYLIFVMLYLVFVIPSKMDCHHPDIKQWNVIPLFNV